MSHTPEPWQYAEHGLRIINGEPTPDWSAEDVQRAVESVNATQGMADPAKDIKEMKDALKEAKDALIHTHSCLQIWYNASGQRCNPEDAHALIRAEFALAKIQTILKP